MNRLARLKRILAATLIITALVAYKIFEFWISHYIMSLVPKT